MYQIQVHTQRMQSQDSRYTLKFIKQAESRVVWSYKQNKIIFKRQNFLITETMSKVKREDNGWQSIELNGKNKYSFITSMGLRLLWIHQIFIKLVRSVKNSLQTLPQWSLSQYHPLIIQCIPKYATIQL